MASLFQLSSKQPVLVFQARHGAACLPLRAVHSSCSSRHRRVEGGSRWSGGNSSRQPLERKGSGPIRAFEGNSSKDPSLEDYVEVRIESVRISGGASIVYLRVVGSESVIPVHIGENESNALLREINKQRQVGGLLFGIQVLAVGAAVHLDSCPMHQMPC